MTTPALRDNAPVGASRDGVAVTVFWTLIAPFDGILMTSQRGVAFGASVRTLRSFAKAYHDLQGTIRDFVLPDPDRKG